MSYRGRGEVVPIDLARQIQAERDRALAQLERTQQEALALRRALDQANARLDQAQAKVDAERQEAVDAVGRLRAERDRATAQLVRLEAAQTEVASREPPAAEVDEARVNELLGDLANVRRRRDLDVAAAVKGEQLRLLRRLADVRDTVHWALAAAPDPASPWYAGLVGIRDQIDRQLRAEGAGVYGEVGDAFDPRLHEALGHAPGGQAGHIQRVEAPGVRLDDGAIVRPARVLVAG